VRAGPTRSMTTSRIHFSKLRGTQRNSDGTKVAHSARISGHITSRWLEPGPYEWHFNALKTCIIRADPRNCAHPDFASTASGQPIPGPLECCSFFWRQRTPDSGFVSHGYVELSETSQCHPRKSLDTSPTSAARDNCAAPCSEP